MIKTLDSEDSRIEIGYIQPVGTLENRPSGFGYLIRVGPFSEGNDKMAIGVYQINGGAIRIVLSIFSFVFTIENLGYYSGSFNKTKCGNTSVYVNYLYSSPGFAGAGGTGYRIFIDSSIEEWRKNPRKILEISKIIYEEGPNRNTFLGLAKDRGIKCNY